MRIKTKIIKCLAIAVTAFMLWGCPSTPLKKETLPIKPEKIVQFASLNLADINKRVERMHIAELVKKIKHEQVEIFAVQGISRYPGVATRVDFVDELSNQTDWRNAFGEMQNISGRQTGNAVFSYYPIISHHNITFDNIKPSFFEAALQATIDVGILSVVVVSTQLPYKASDNEQTRCMESITELNRGGADPFTIISGNLPSNDKFHFFNSLSDVLRAESGKNNVPKIWYSANDSYQLISTQTLETGLGTLIIAKIGLYRKK